MQQLLAALKPLGVCKERNGQIKINCPICEKSGSAIDKYNLEVKASSVGGFFHCWACNYKGTLYKLVKEYGFKEYLHLFDTRPAYEKGEGKEAVIFELPHHIYNVLNHKESTEYLLSRGLTKEKIREREIKYCYSGVSKGTIIFPSYSSTGELKAFVIHQPKLKKYYVNKKENFVCFYESFIDKRVPIILTEGVFDSLVIPNAIPILGTTVFENLLIFLSYTEVIYAPDGDLLKKIKKETFKKLQSVCEKTHFLSLPPKCKDINEAFIKDKVVLIDSLRQFYLKQNSV